MFIYIYDKENNHTQDYKFGKAHIKDIYCHNN